MVAGRASTQRQCVAFEQRKRVFLGKLDKSAAGHIDAKAVEICDVLNKRQEFFTTSSCAGRCFLWRGDGVKSTTEFSRFRVSHDMVRDPAEQYFDLSTVSSESEYLEGALGGNGPHRPVADGLAQHAKAPATARSTSSCFAGLSRLMPSSRRAPAMKTEETWLRFEPFILHVCCRDFEAATALISAARSVFKNVGLQGWGEGKLIVAICGDEGLDMPLTLPDGTWLFEGQAQWLQRLVNDRHQRNWSKIDRFTAACLAMPEPSDDVGVVANDEYCSEGDDVDVGDIGDSGTKRARRPGPRRYDVVGDIAILNGVAPPLEEREAVGKAIMADAGQVKLVVARSTLSGDHRAPDAFVTIAGRPRAQLMTTHAEFGVRYVIDLSASFFSTRMAAERQRQCQLVQPGERVLVLFAGCGPEALQLAAKSAAAKVTSVEINGAATRCARRGAELLQKANPEAADRLEIIEGDARTVLPQLPRRSFARILAPRPKGAGDGDGGGTEAPSGGGAEWLELLLPLLQDGGVCHWYDFAADWELPECTRTREIIEVGCKALGLNCEILRAAPANRRTIAERQYRVVVDFKVRTS